MRSIKRASQVRLLAALAGALAILALVAGPGLAHPGSISGSRIYEPSQTWPNSQTRFGFTAAIDSATSDQADKDALEAEDTDTGADENDQGEQEGADENNDDQGADENDQGDDDQADESHDGGSGGDDEDSGEHGSDGEGGD